MKGIEQNIRAMPSPDAWSAALTRIGSIARSARESGDWELASHPGENDRPCSQLCGWIFCAGLVPA